MGKYPPHGIGSIYESGLVRMARRLVIVICLVDGQVVTFGSVDGIDCCRRAVYRTTDEQISNSVKCFGILIKNTVDFHVTITWY